MTIYQILMTKYHRIIAKYYSLTTINYLHPSTSVENPLQISPFLTNKANSPIVQTHLTYILTMIYINFISLTKVKFKANQTQFKAKQTRFWANFKGGKPETNPIKANNHLSLIDNHLEGASLLTDLIILVTVLSQYRQNQNCNQFLERRIIR